MPTAHPHTPAPSVRGAIHLLQILPVLLVLSACAAPNAKPFQDFSQTTREVGSATQKALKESVSESREGLIDSIQDTAGFNNLKLYFRSDPGNYLWGNRPDGSWVEQPPGLAPSTGPLPVPTSTSPPPPPWLNYYYKPQRVAAQIDAFNQVQARYAALLAGLAGKDYLSAEEFKKMAAGLNAQASKLGRQAGMTSPADTALFSTAATTLFEEYLKARQKALLRNALRENAETFQKFCDLGTQLTYLLSVPIQRSYNDSFDALGRRFATAKTDAARRKVAQAAVALNDAMIQRWELFANLDALYAELPQAHRELAGAVDGAGGSHAALQLTQHVAQLLRVYEALKESNEKSARSAAQD